MTNKEAKLNHPRKPDPDEIVRLLLGEFGDRDIEIKTSSDDGGSVAEIWVYNEESSSDLRKIIPLNYEGWRTVVIKNR